MWEMRVHSLGQRDPLKEVIATHSSILAWRIARTEEPGGVERVTRDWSSLARTHAQQDYLNGYTLWFENTLQAYGQRSLSSWGTRVMFSVSVTHRIFLPIPESGNWHLWRHLEFKREHERPAVVPLQSRFSELSFHPFEASLTRNVFALWWPPASFGRMNITKNMNITSQPVLFS
jgi:hypothetical protein